MEGRIVGASLHENVNSKTFSQIRGKQNIAVNTTESKRQFGEGGQVADNLQTSCHWVVPTRKKIKTRLISKEMVCVRVENGERQLNTEWLGVAVLHVWLFHINTENSMPKIQVILVIFFKNRRCHNWNYFPYCRHQEPQWNRRELQRKIHSQKKMENFISNPSILVMLK